jgi:hypothetical protein
MKNKLFSVALVSSLALAASNTPAKSVIDAPAVKLKIAVAQGQKFDYVMSMTVDTKKKGSSKSMTVRMGYRETVQLLKPSQQTWDVKFTSGTLRGTGLPASASDQFWNAMKNVKVQIVRDSYGRVLSSKANGVDAPTNGASEIELPRTGVNVGTKWYSSSEFQGISVDWTHTAEAFQTMRGTKVVRIASVASGSNTISTPKPCLSFIEVKTGRPVFMQGQFWANTGAESTKVRYEVMRR